MPAHRRTDAALWAAVRLVRAAGGNTSLAARQAGVSLGTLSHQIRDARGRFGEDVLTRPLEDDPGDFTAPDLPDVVPSAEELLETRRKAYARKQTAATAKALLPIRVHLDGPIGILHGGDPHLDDDGTDIALIERHVAIVQGCPGLLGANVGDYSNNWVGRLAHLYSQQSTSAREALVLVEWLIRSMRWLYLIGGNHDAWSGDGDPIRWFARQSNSLYQQHGVRLALTFPNGKIVRINARHDFKGHSQWNTAHGPAKAATMGWRDHILACGHTHVSGYQVLKDPASGLISHALRVSSYKKHDRYADQLGLANQDIFCAPVTIIDPRFADDDPRLITTIFDPESAADYLTWLRARATRDSRKR